MVPVSDIPNAIYACLSADATLGALLSTTDAIFPKEAPEGTEYPFVVYRQISGVTERGFHDNNARNQVWLIEGVCRGGDPEPAEAIDARLEELLDDASLPLESGRLIGFLREADAPAHEIDGGELVIHAGGLYRVMYE